MKNEKILKTLKIISLILLAIYTLYFIGQYSYANIRNDVIDALWLKSLTIITYINRIIYYAIYLLIPISVLIYMLRKRKGEQNIVIISNSIIIQLVSSIMSIISIIVILITSINYFGQLYKSYQIILTLLYPILYALLLWSIIKKSNNKTPLYISCIGITLLEAYNVVNTFISLYRSYGSIKTMMNDNIITLVILLIISIMNIASYIILLKILQQNDYEKDSIDYKLRIKEINKPTKIILISHIILIITTIFTINITYISTMNSLPCYIILISFFILTNQKEYTLISLILYGIPAISTMIMLSSFNSLILIVALAITIIVIEKISDKIENNSNPIQINNQNNNGNEQILIPNQNEINNNIEEMK